MAHLLYWMSQHSIRITMSYLSALSIDALAFADKIHTFFCWAGGSTCQYPAIFSYYFYCEAIIVLLLSVL